MNENYFNYVKSDYLPPSSARRGLESGRKKRAGSHFLPGGLRAVASLVRSGGRPRVKGGWSEFIQRGNKYATISIGQVKTERAEKKVNIKLFKFGLKRFKRILNSPNNNNNLHCPSHFSSAPNVACVKRRLASSTCLRHMPWRRWPGHLRDQASRSRP